MRDAIQRDTAFELPELREDEDGLSYMLLPYVAATEDAMLPEETDE